jgi:hypothetical protein
MEYYALMFNRTYMLTVTHDQLVGQVCRGMTAVEGGGDALTRAITQRLAVRGDLTDPASYVSSEVLAREHRANFSVALTAICSVVHNPRRKWGMGPYPHDGRVMVRTAHGSRELIVLGAQSGRKIAEDLKAAVERANNSSKPTPLRGAA